MSDRSVQTIYGPVPGCPECGLIPLRGPLLCEHGVTPTPDVSFETAVEIVDEALYRRLTSGDAS